MSFLVRSWQRWELVQPRCGQNYGRVLLYESKVSFCQLYPPSIGQVDAWASLTLVVSSAKGCTSYGRVPSESKMSLCQSYPPTFGQVDSETAATPGALEWGDSQPRDHDSEGTS